MDIDELECRKKFHENRSYLDTEFKKTHRTRQHHPIADSDPIFEKPSSDWKSTEFIRLITFQITGLHTVHAQENLVILREFLNECEITDPKKLLVDSKLKNGNGNFYTRARKQKFSYNFEGEGVPTKDNFMRDFEVFLST